MQGKSDFVVIENYRGDRFFKRALGIRLLPSSPKLRQRLIGRTLVLFEHVPGIVEALLRGQWPSHRALSSDVSAQHAAKRKRLKSVMQELTYRAGRLIERGRRLILGLGANDRAAKAFARLNEQLFAQGASG